MIEAFDAYGHALVSLALWPILLMVLNFTAVPGKTPENTLESGHPKRDYSSSVYRRSRAQANAMEISGPFIAATVAAILAGAAPFWVNMLASAFVVSRIATALVHIRTENQSLRSATWMVGFLSVIGLVILAVWAAL